MVAARALDCREILSEDLNTGQNYAGIRVVNPFAKRRKIAAIALGDFNQIRAFDVLTSRQA